MNHQLSFANDMPLMALYIAGVIVLIGVLLFAVQVKDLDRRASKHPVIDNNQLQD